MPIPLYLLSIKKQAYPMHEGKAPRTHFFVFGSSASETIFFACFYATLTCTTISEVLILKKMNISLAFIGNNPGYNLLHALGSQIQRIQ